MKRYVICGVSNRAISMFIKPMFTTFKQHAKLVGLLDPDPRRFEVYQDIFPEHADVPQYAPDDFNKMIEQTKPDAVIVTSADFTHAHYIIESLEKDLDVITEKPMVTTGEDSVRVLEAEAKSKGQVTVTFNYRYTPTHRKIKELLLEGKVGRITSIDLNWYIDTYHGASYFKRWNRKRENSGGLSIHKSTHHFDLINWWTEQNPVEAFAYGALNYYGPDSEMNPLKADGRYCETCEVKDDCHYIMRWTTRSRESDIKDDHIGSMQTKRAGKYSNYRPDACIFDSEINIEDTYTATVKYDRGALLSYSINFSSPYEGYRLAINGTRGRLETQHYTVPSRVPFAVPDEHIDYYPLFGGAKETIYPLPGEGAHGGGDLVLQEDLFLGPDPKRGYEIMSGAKAGANAVLVGEAVWQSVERQSPVKVKGVLKS